MVTSNGLAALFQILEQPLRAAWEPADSRVASLSMKHAVNVLSKILDDPFIVAFSSWPIGHQWEIGLRPRVGKTQLGDPFNIIWDGVTVELKRLKLSLNPFLSYLCINDRPALNHSRFIVEIGLAEAEPSTAMSIYNLKEDFRSGGVMTHRLRAATCERNWNAFFESQRHASTAQSPIEWLGTYRALVSKIGACIRATRLVLIPFIRDSAGFAKRTSAAFGGCMAVYCRDVVSQSEVKQIVLHELASQLFRTIEEPKRIRMEARESQTASMLSSFGHDGKRWATIIKSILNTGWDGSASAASLFATSLEARLATYSRLSKSLDNRSGAVTSIKNDLLRARRSQAEAMFGEKYLIDLHKLLLVEIVAVVTRICVDETEQWRTVANALFGRGEEGRLRFFQCFFGSDDTFRSFLRSQTSNAELEAKLEEYGVKTSYLGPLVRFPEQLPGNDGESTSPLLYTCLRFIFSELLTNVVKHQWSRGPGASINITLNVTMGATHVECTLDTSPGVDAVTTMDTGSESLIGLTSLRLALQACGGDCITRTLTADGVNLGEYPFPFVKDGHCLSKFQLDKSGFDHE